MGGATIGPGGTLLPHFQTQGGQGGHNLGIILISNIQQHTCIYSLHKSKIKQVTERDSWIKQAKCKVTFLKQLLFRATNIAFDDSRSTSSTCKLYSFIFPNCITRIPLHPHQHLQSDSICPVSYTHLTLPTKRIV